MSSPVRANGDPRPTIAIDRGFLLETIALDLNMTGAHIAAITTLMNACLARNADWTLRSWRHVLMDNSGIMQLALRYAGDAGLEEKLNGAIARLYREVSRAKVEVAPLMTRAAAYGEAERRLLGEACPRWRRLAGEAARVIADMASHRSLAPIVLKDCATLAAFLSEAANGDAQRVRANGEIMLPAIDQRRRSARMNVRLNCKVELPDRTIPGVLEDVSREGARVHCAQPLVAGQKLALAFENGRRLQAIVVRWSGERAGLRLEAPLSANDPLFRPARAGA